MNDRHHPRVIEEARDRLRPPLCQNASEPQRRVRGTEVEQRNRARRMFVGDHGRVKGKNHSSYIERLDTDRVLKLARSTGSVSLVLTRQLEAR